MSCQKLRSDVWRLSAVILVLAIAASAAAQENEVADEGDAQQVAAEAEQAAEDAAEATVAGAEDVPTKGESDAARRERDEKALLVAPGTAQNDDLFGPPSTKKPAKKASPQNLDDDPFGSEGAERARRRHKELMQQRQQALSEEQRLQAEQQMRKAMAEYERAVQQRPDIEKAQAMLEQQMKQLELQRSELAKQAEKLQLAQQVAAMRQQQQPAPLPKDGAFQVFPLRYGQAGETAQVLSQILGGTPMRLAVDHRTNSLLVFADKDTTEKIRSLVDNLDARPAGDKEKKAMAAETLQLRFVWLLDGIEDEGQAPPAALVGDQVVLALGELGFNDPKVVCQQVTTLTLNVDGRPGKFNFQVPVLIESEPWQFDGFGSIVALADDRFNLQFNLQFQQNMRGEQAGQLGGSIHMPKGHYTVMGTTTFVAVNEKISTVDGEDRPKQYSRQQHLSAFVVYLDRAQSFPAGSVTPSVVK